MRVSWHSPSPCCTERGCQREGWRWMDGPPPRSQQWAALLPPPPHTADLMPWVHKIPHGFSFQTCVRPLPVSVRRWQISLGTRSGEVAAEARAELDAKDEDGWTPLQRAAYFGNTDCAKALLQGLHRVQGFWQSPLKSHSEEPDSAHRVKFRSKSLPTGPGSCRCGSWLPPEGQLPETTE